MLAEGRDVCSECGHIECLCRHFGFGVSERTEAETNNQVDCPDCLGGLSIGFGIIPRCDRCNSTGKVPRCLGEFQGRVRKAIGSPVGTNLDLFGAT